jgi:hypothetical protein
VRRFDNFEKAEVNSKTNHKNFIEQLTSSKNFQHGKFTKKVSDQLRNIRIDKWQTFANLQRF